MRHVLNAWTAILITWAKSWSVTWLRNMPNNVKRQRINYRHSPSQQKTDVQVIQSSLFTAKLPNKRTASTTKEIKLSTWKSQERNTRRYLESWLLRVDLRRGTSFARPTFKTLKTLCQTHKAINCPRQRACTEITRPSCLRSAFYPPNLFHDVNMGQWPSQSDVTFGQSQPPKIIICLLNPPIRGRRWQELQRCQQISVRLSSYSHLQYTMMHQQGKSCGFNALPAKAWQPPPSVSPKYYKYYNNNCCLISSLLSRRDCSY
jgi:hypothetical protein